jgi:radical SAM protein with 4Fe4S-binding SPASM domain
MGVELRPLGVKCNIQCQYCYQNPQRDAGNVSRAYDLEKMRAAIATSDSGFILFGGEPLMVPEMDLEALWSWGFQKYGKNGIQTNGTRINDNHVRMFKQYRVHVGISVDGPGELNDVRWAGSLERTRDATAKTHGAIARLCKEEIPPSVIVTLHRCNATREKLPVMHDWFRYLQSIGVSNARLHILEVENVAIRQKYALTTAENVEAFLSFLALESELTTLRFDVFEDMRNLLLGADDKTACVWNACDPYTTRAVQGVEGNGQRSNCGRTNKDGIDFTKAGTEGFERSLALYHTPQAHGGCNGCRFFLMCKGQCPGTAIDGDWRNRTEYCDVWKALYQRLEQELLEQGLSPISLRPDRLRLEQCFLKAWTSGHNQTITSALQRLNQESLLPAPAKES